MYYNKIICLNCGKKGHLYKRCDKPTVSYGLITYTIINSEIQYLLIQRKHSLEFIEFMRGRYFIEYPETIKTLFNKMILFEKDLIRNNSFDELWDNLWGDSENTNNNYKLEYETSKKLYIELKNTNQLNKYCDMVSKCNELEWGFPKGRKNINEKALKCALREFYEETNIRDCNICFIKHIKPIKEFIVGSNGIQYIHVYYLSKIKFRNDLLTPNNTSSEINDIQLMNYKKTKNKIRLHHFNKLKILDNINNFIQTYENKSE